MTDYSGAPPGIVQSDTVDLDDGRVRCAWDSRNEVRCRSPATHQLKVGRMWLSFCAKHPTKAYGEGREDRPLPPRSAIPPKRDR